MKKTKTKMIIINSICYGYCGSVPRHNNYTYRLVVFISIYLLIFIDSAMKSVWWMRGPLLITIIIRKKERKKKQKHESHCISLSISGAQWGAQYFVLFLIKIVSKRNKNKHFVAQQLNYHRNSDENMQMLFSLKLIER